MSSLFQALPDQRMLLIGNAVSLAAACFTLASAWSRERRRIYTYQAVQCLLMAVANVFFCSVSGVTTFLLCTLRNLLLARDRFTARRCLFFVIAVALLGVGANNRGLVGLIPVVTTAVYTVGCFYARRTRAIKLNLIVNLSLWAAYNFLILDLVSGVVDSCSAVAALLSLLRTPPEETQ